MSDIREAEVKRDLDGRVISERERRVEGPPKTGGIAAMLFTLILIVGGIFAFAYSEGSFEKAGAEADRIAAKAEQQAGAAIEGAGDMLDNAGEAIGPAGIAPAEEPVTPPADMNDLPDEPVAPN